MNHDLCSTSTGICGSLTAGQGELDANGYWEVPCIECEARANARYAMALEKRLDDLIRLTSWRPLNQIPTEEEHKWCKGRYLLRIQPSEATEPHIAGRIKDMWPFPTGSVYSGYLLIPPTDDRLQRLPKDEGDKP